MNCMHARDRRRASRGARTTLIMVLLLSAAPLLQAQSNPVKLVKGVITDAKDGTPVDGGMITVYRNGSTDVANTSRISHEGGYQVILGPATDYRFVVDSPHYHNRTFMVTTPPGGNYEETIQDFTLDAITIGRVVYQGRLFDVGSTDLLSDPAFVRALDTLSRKASIIFTVWTAADDTRDLDAADAKAMARERARAIKEAIKEQNISLVRIRWALSDTAVSAQEANAKLTITAINDEEE